MKNFISFLTFFLLFSISQDILSSKRLVIENVMVIDAINPVRKEMTVIVDGDEIISIKKSNLGEAVISDEDIIVDGRDKFLSPAYGMPMFI